METGVDPAVMAVHFDIALPDQDCTVIDAHASDALLEDVEMILKIFGDGSESHYYHPRSGVFV